MKDAEPLGRNIIHSVTNPIPRLTGAIHVYGGDFFGAVPVRKEWDPESLREQPYNIEKNLRLFEEANAILASGKGRLIVVGLWDGRAPSRLNILEICRTFARRSISMNTHCRVFRTSGSRFWRARVEVAVTAAVAPDLRSSTPWSPLVPGREPGKGGGPFQQHVENRGQRLGSGYRCAPCRPTNRGPLRVIWATECDQANQAVTIAGATNPDAGDQTTAYTFGQSQQNTTAQRGMAGSNRGTVQPRRAEPDAGEAAGMDAPNNLPPLQRRRQLNDQRNIGLI